MCYIFSLYIDVFIIFYHYYNMYEIYYENYECIVDSGYYEILIKFEVLVGVIYENLNCIANWIFWIFMFNYFDFDLKDFQK